MISKKRIITILVFLISGLFVHGQDCVELFFEQTTNGSEVNFQLKANNFTDITTFQMSVVYPANNLEYLDFTSNAILDIPNGNVNGTQPGTIKLIWSQPVSGETLLNGETIIDLRFNILNTDPSTIQIVDLENFDIEITDSSLELTCFSIAPITINETLSVLSGKVYHDVNENCIADDIDDPAKNTKLMILGMGNTYYRTTDNFGNYSIALPIGDYTVAPISNLFWTACTPIIGFNIDEDGKEYTSDFVMSKAVDCPGMKVNIAAPRMRRCIDNTYVVQYANEGTTVANDAYIEILLDDNTTYVSNNTSGFSIDGQLATIQLGDVEPGEEASFEIIVNVDCVNSLEGNTICSEARVFPEAICDPPATWSGAFLNTNIQCDGDSIILIIENQGLQDMLAPLQSIVVEDDVMINIQNIELAALSNTTYKLEADGSVYRILTEQEADFPFGNFTSRFVESCNGMNNTSFQFVSMFQEGDESPFLDTECNEIINSFNPNDKLAYPVGYRDLHEINPNEDIEYTIRFQNPGTDTISYLYIEDVIDPSLDISSFEPGPSSHLYTASFTDERTLRLDFFNALLPDQQSNPQESVGFVKYRISQNRDLPDGTEIRNTSTIYYDYIAQITTNETMHTVSTDFIDVLIGNDDFELIYDISIGPNPSIANMEVKVSDAPSQMSYEIYSTNGAVVRAAKTVSDVFTIEKEDIQSGVYYLVMKSEQKVIGVEQIVFE